MYIVYYKFSVDSGFDWEPLLERQDKSCEKHGIKRVGTGTPLGVFASTVEVFKTDLEPTDFIKFVSENMYWEGKSLGTTSTNVVLRTR